MKKILITCLIVLSLSCQAQFVEKNAPTETELDINNATTIPPLLQYAAKARKAKNYPDLTKALEKAVSLKPNIPLFKYKLAEAYALSGNKSGAFDALVALQKQGLYFDVANNDSFANIKEFPVFDYIKQNFDANGDHYGEGKDVYKVDKSFSGLLFESFAIDEKHQFFLMGSLRDGRVIKVGNDGSISDLIEPSKGGSKGPWSIVDLAVDEKNNTLWVASVAVSQYTNISKQTNGLAGVFKYNLKTGELLESFYLPQKAKPYMIGSIHLTQQGELYLVESIRNSILKLDTKSKDFKLILKSNEFNNLRKITADETGRYLYVSGADQGILVIDVKSQKTYLIKNTVALSLIGISDLIYDNNGLIIIQSGIKPERVMRLQLNKTKLLVTNVFPIESAHPRFNNVSNGDIFAGGVYYVANSQIGKTNPMGGLLAGQAWEDVFVVSSAKHYKEQETLDYQKEVDKYRK